MNRLPSQLTYNDLNGLEATEVLVDWFRQLLASQPLLQPHLTLPMAVMKLDIAIQIDMHVGGTVPVASPPDTVIISGEVELTNNVSRFDSADLLARNMPRREAPAESCFEHIEETVSATVNAAPIPGGIPPDQIREQHELPVPRPGYGDRATGSHLFLADIINNDKERRGIVADGYTFAREQPTGASAQVLEQTIPIDDGSIQIDMTGHGIRHDSGIVVKVPDHRASVKEAGDQKGSKYGSVNGVLDAGPAGLMRKSSQGGGGLGGDGRTRLSFGNSHRG